MQTLRCLYFDDSEEQQSRFGGWIEREWKWLDTGVSIELKIAKTPEDAVAQLSLASFQLFIADILVGKGRAAKPLGLKAIADARSDHPLLSILALSIGNGGFEDRARSAGADGYVSKGHMIENPDEHILAAKILEVLRSRGHEPALSDPEILEFDDDDPELAVIVHLIGRENIVNLSVRGLSQRCTRVIPHAIRSGLSGATVLRVDCDLQVESGRPPDSRFLLLKASRSDDALRSELTKDISMFPDELFVRFITREPVRSGQWYALASGFKVSSTILDWMIGKQQLGQAVEEMLSALFLESGLGDVYRGSVFVPNVRPNIEIGRLITPFRGARILRAISSLEQLASKHTPDGQFDPSLLIGFVRLGAVGRFRREEIRKGVYTNWSHGDLHGRNVLVTAHGPRLIDPANVDQFHWGADLARFIVDLFVSGWDAGVASHEWELFPSWVRTASRLVHGEEILTTASPSNSNIAVALSWMRDNVDAVCGATPETKWQFWLAVAVEFLRTSYRIEELPTPKRVLGLASACLALREAESGIIAAGANI